MTMQWPECATGGSGNRRGPACGFTLVELMIVAAIGGLLVAVTVPRYADRVAARELANAAQQLEASMNLARAEAIKRGGRVTLCRTADQVRCTGAAGWDAGWLVFVDRNRNGEIDADEPVLRRELPAARSVRIAANRPVADYVSFTSLGNARLLSGALQMGTFTLCRPGLPATHVVLANSGRVRVETSRDPCG
jgi:type IV fimbrial biogenesis protein FimT